MVIISIMSIDPGQYPSIDDTMMAQDSNQSAARQPVRVTRRFNVNISGSMQDFESMGKTAATWQPVDNCHTELFGADLEAAGLNTSDHSSVTNAIGNAVIVKATML